MIPVSGTYNTIGPIRPADQKNTSVGHWAPIVETNQGSYSGTNAMGALNIKLRSADNNNQWGDWELLSPKDSIVLPPSEGFQLEFPIDPNYDFIVVSPNLERR